MLRGSESKTPALLLHPQTTAALGAYYFDRRNAEQIKRLPIRKLAFLYLALFGTTFGGNFDVHEENHFSLKPTTAPNLQVTTREIRQSIGNVTLRWNRLDADSYGKSSWTALAAGHTVGAFVASDRTMVLLTFPSALLHKHRKTQGFSIHFAFPSAASPSPLMR